MTTRGSISFADWLWPQRHETFWTADRVGRPGKDDVLAFLATLSVRDVPTASATLAHAEAIARSAVDRASAAERRATTIAGAVAIATSLTLSGAGVVLDGSKLASASLRSAFAILLLFATTAFVLSAIYALRALVHTRIWNWSLPSDLPKETVEPLETLLGLRAARLLNDFARNWEIAVLKDRTVDRALWFLGAALCGIVGLAIVILLALI